MGESPRHQPLHVQRLCSECNRPIAPGLRQCADCLRQRARENARISGELGRAFRHVRAVRSGSRRRDWIDRALLREY